MHRTALESLGRCTGGREDGDHSSRGSQLQLQLCRWSARTFVLDEMLGVLAAIGASCQSVTFNHPAEEAERHGQLARLAVGDGGEIPLVAVAPRLDDVLAHLAVQAARLVPYGGRL